MNIYEELDKIERDFEVPDDFMDIIKRIIKADRERIRAALITRIEQCKVGEETEIINEVLGDERQ